MTFRLQIPLAIHDALIAQARAELPNECVGLLAGLPDGLVLERYPLVNSLADPRRFLSEPRSMFEAEKKRRAAGLEFLAVYHSHPTNPAVPSRTDLENNYSEDVMCLIVSLMHPEPVVKAYWLTSANFREAEYVVVP
jgi:proteasome lid subunit RPN8/RPN11